MKKLKAVSEDFSSVTHLNAPIYGSFHLNLNFKAVKQSEEGQKLFLARLMEDETGCREAVES